MENMSLMLGIVIGGIIAYLIANTMNKSKNVSKVEYDNLNQQLNDTKIKLGVLEDKNSELTKENSKKYDNIQKLSAENSNLTSEISKLNAYQDALKEKLDNQKNEVENLQKSAHLHFEQIANKILEEKSKKFTESNKLNLEVLLSPLKEDINRFKDKVESTHTEDTKQRTSLEERIKALLEQTSKVSEEANNLASALKGKSQKRGNWGEMILERILESSGLTRDREYFVQNSIKDDEGKTQRLDVKVILPDNRQIIIDSKVSLIAYDQYVASEDSDEQKKFLTEHINATKLHINQLSDKKYDNIDSTLDFTMMFIPIEPAYLLAVQGDENLWSFAYSKRILLVSPTTLIACLKLFSDLWRREWQNKNAMEIVKRGELLYEKFVSFTKNFEEIGKKLNATQAAYDDAFNQLSTGRGNVISQALQLKKLGLKSDKNIPEKLLPPNLDEDENLD